jgi:hypothetical protein
VTIYPDIDPPYILLLEPFRTHGLLVYQFAATEASFCFKMVAPGQMRPFAAKGLIRPHAKGSPAIFEIYLFENCFKKRESETRKRPNI